MNTALLAQLLAAALTRAEPLLATRPLLSIGLHVAAGLFAGLVPHGEPTAAPTATPTATPTAK